MITKLYSVYDAAVGAYLTPFFARSHGEALRSFQDAINDPKTSLNAHPHDFSLFYVGTFNDGSADLAGLQNAEKLLSGTEALIRDISPK